MLRKHQHDNKELERSQDEDSGEDCQKESARVAWSVVHHPEDKKIVGSQGKSQLSSGDEKRKTKKKHLKSRGGVDQHSASREKKFSDFDRGIKFYRSEDCVDKKSEALELEELDDFETRLQLRR